jgi:HAD superfamily hydrolase (TIGR01509 family)
MSYQAVLFDLDGVIVDSEAAHQQAFIKALARHGYDLTNEDYIRYYAGKTDQAGFRDYFAARQETVDVPALMTEKAQVYLQLAGNHLVAYPGVVDFIHSLAARQVLLALVTGSLRVEADLTLQTFGVDDLFGAVIAAEDISESKPSPQGYLLAAGALDVDPAMCVVIEDAPSGVQAALAAGIRCLAVTTTHSAGELSQATKVVPELNPECLDSL